VNFANTEYRFIYLESDLYIVYCINSHEYTLMKKENNVLPGPSEKLTASSDDEAVVEAKQLAKELGWL